MDQSIELERIVIVEKVIKVVFQSERDRRRKLQAIRIIHICNNLWRR